MVGAESLRILFKICEIFEKRKEHVEMSCVTEEWIVKANRCKLCAEMLAILYCIETVCRKIANFIE